MKSPIYIIIVFFFFAAVQLNAQKKYSSIEEVHEGLMNQPANFQTMQKEMNQYFQDNPEDKGFKKWKRQEWFLEQRFYPSGEYQNITAKNMRAFQTYAKAFPEQVKTPESSLDRSPHGSWSFIGPNNTNVGGGQGRINSVDIHPTNTSIIWVTSPNGGIWRSTNSGSSWSNMTSSLPIISFADLEINYNNPNIIYALSGDGDPNTSPGAPHSQPEVRSIGVLRTTDGGSTWLPTNFSFDVSSSPVIPTQLKMHPTNPNIQFVASKNGIYKTTNGWVTNTQVFTGTIYDIEFHPTSSTIMYASGSSTIRRSIDGGDTWTLVSDTDFSTMSGSSRIDLAVSPNAANWVYAIAGDWTNGSKSVMRSISSGANNTWTVRDQTTNVIGAFATYCIALAVDPFNANRVFGGGVGTWTSGSGGFTGTWSQVNQGVVHADVHDMVYRNGSIYVASDGGLFRSSNNGATWTDLSAGLQVTEIYRMSGTNANSNLYFLGTQDNGTYRKNSASTTFTRVLGADGMDNIIDYNNSNNIYACTQNGGFNKSTNGGGSFSGIAIAGSGNWITPILQDPITSTRIFVGKDNCYRSNSSGNAGTFSAMGGSPWFGSLNCIAQGKSFNSRMYVSTGGSIFRTDNALISPASSVTWTNVSAGLPGSFITDIAVDPTNSSHVVVTLSGFSVGNKVYESFSAGNSSSWVNISGALPNTPINCIEFHEGPVNDPLYIGTDIGVFYRDNTLGDWIYFSDFLPSVPVNDLFINTTSNTVTAASYGRGLWRSDLKSGCFNTISFSVGVVHGGEIHYAYNTSITSAATLNTTLGTDIYYQAGGFVELREGFRAADGTQFEAKIGPCPN